MLTLTGYMGRRSIIFGFRNASTIDCRSSRSIIFWSCRGDHSIISSCRCIDWSCRGIYTADVKKSYQNRSPFHRSMVHAVEPFPRFHRNAFLPFGRFRSRSPLAKRADSVQKTRHSSYIITKHGSTWYIGMAHVPRHRFHTFEKSHFQFQFQ